MPRAVRKRTGAAAVRYDPRAVSSHRHDTRLARHQNAGINRLPSEILIQILARVPWQRARGVCRTWATLRPAPDDAAMQAEATRAVARMAWRAYEVAMRAARAMRHKIGMDLLADAKRQFILQYLQHAFGGAPPQNAAALRKALSGDFVFWMYANTERQEVVGLHMAMNTPLPSRPCYPDEVSVHIPIVFDEAIPQASTRATKELGRLTTRDRQIVYMLHRRLRVHGLWPLFKRVPSLFGGHVCDDVQQCEHFNADESYPFQNK